MPLSVTEDGMPCHIYGSWAFTDGYTSTPGFEVSITAG